MFDRNFLCLYVCCYCISFIFRRKEEITLVDLKRETLNMVCEKCEKKLGRVITPDKWKDGARNTTESGMFISVPHRVTVHIFFL